MFIIDKGSSDGIKVDMNVIAGGGLVGIVTKTGPDWAQVRSIIDDMSNVSAMILKNSDLCYVCGDLEMMSEGTLQLNQLRDQNDEVESGDKVVNSYASAKYHKDVYKRQVCQGRAESMETCGDPGLLDHAGRDAGSCSSIYIQ